MILQDTRILITIQMIDDTNELVYLFAIATSLFELLARFATYIAGWLSDIQEAVIVTGKVLLIGFNSLRFGFGW